MYSYFLHIICISALGFLFFYICENYCEKSPNGEIKMFISWFAKLVKVNIKNDFFPQLIDILR